MLTNTGDQNFLLGDVDYNYTLISEYSEELLLLRGKKHFQYDKVNYVRGSIAANRFIYPFALAYRAKVPIVVMTLKKATVNKISSVIEKLANIYKNKKIVVFLELDENGLVETNQALKTIPSNILLFLGGSLDITCKVTPLLTLDVSSDLITPGFYTAFTEMKRRIIEKERVKTGQDFIKVTNFLIAMDDRVKALAISDTNIMEIEEKADNNITNKKDNSVAKADSSVILPGKIKENFKSIAGQHKAKKQLKQIMDFIRNPEKYKKFGVTVPRNVIMYGPPGTGKTSLARALAGESNVAFISLSATEMINAYYGESATRIRNLFSLARKYAPAIIFIDEVDAIAQKRNERNSNNLEMVNELLTQLDNIDPKKNKNIFVLAATNNIKSIDEALLRPGRFDRKIFIDLPTEAERLELIKILAKSYPLAKNIQSEQILNLTISFSPAEIKKLFNESAIPAINENSDFIEMKHFELTAKEISNK